ncbi:MAG: helix-turn-helix domain-containing protein [Tissierellales bacterium]
MKNQYNLPCNIAQTLNIIGDKWTLLILRQLSKGHDTYNSILENLEGIPSNLLSSRLKSLEEDGLIFPVLYQSHPPRYRYILTDGGKDLDDIFYSMILWGKKHLDKCYKELTHNSCNHNIELKYYCPHCGKTVNKNEITVNAGKDYPR